MVVVELLLLYFVLSISCMQSFTALQHNASIKRLFMWLSLAFNSRSKNELSGNNRSISYSKKDNVNELEVLDEAFYLRRMALAI